MLPTVAALPKTMPLTSQATADVEPPVTVAVNCWFWVVATEAVVGDMVIVTFESLFELLPPPHAIRNSSNKKTSRNCNCLIVLLHFSPDECPVKLWEIREYGSPSRILDLRARTCRVVITPRSTKVADTM